jgi:hypothetical protein
VGGWGQYISPSGRHHRGPSQEPVAAASRVFVKSAALWCDFHENLSRDVQWHNGEERTKLWFPSTESPGNRCVSEHITSVPRAKFPGLRIRPQKVESSPKCQNVSLHFHTAPLVGGWRWRLGLSRTWILSVLAVWDRVSTPRTARVFEERGFGFCSHVECLMAAKMLGATEFSISQDSFS